MVHKCTLTSHERSPWTPLRNSQECLKTFQMSLTIWSAWGEVVFAFVCFKWEILLLDSSIVFSLLAGGCFNYFGNVLKTLTITILTTPWHHSRTKCTAIITTTKCQIHAVIILVWQLIKNVIKKQSNAGECEWFSDPWVQSGGSVTVHLQPDTNSLRALIRGCVTSLPAHLFLITRAAQINVVQSCCFSEASVDMLTALCNLFLLLTDNETTP